MNAPPPGAPDAMKLSRMIRLVTDYVQEGLIPRPERPFTQMTEGELDTLIEAARAKRTANEEPAEAEPAEEPAEAPEEEPQAAGGGGTAMPRPKQPQQPEPHRQEEGNVSEEGGISDSEFREKFPIGQRVNYNGQEHVVISHSKPGAEGETHFHAIGLEQEPTQFTLSELEEGDFEPWSAKPTKIPAKVEYPPQVFLLARVVEGNAVGEIFTDHKKLLAAHPDIDGDVVMEAISDPGEPQGVDAGTLTFASVG